MKKLMAIRLFVLWFSGKISKLMTLAVIVFLAAPHFTFAAAFTVNSTADVNDVSPGNGVCETAPGNGVCTLRAAIQESNALPGFPPEQVNLLAGTYVLTEGRLEIQQQSVSYRGRGGFNDYRWQQCFRHISYFQSRNESHRKYFRRNDPKRGRRHRKRYRHLYQRRKLPVFGEQSS